MAMICPETNDYVLYLDCQECETKSCLNDDKKEDIQIKESNNNQKKIKG